MVAVNEVDIDSRGEHIATCSHDGKVLILGLFTEANNQNLNFAHMVHSVSLDPDPKAADFKRFIVGNIDQKKSPSFPAHFDTNR